jgi:hypothetical protein
MLLVGLLFGYFVASVLVTAALVRLFGRTEDKAAAALPAADRAIDKIASRGSVVA